MSTTVDYEVQNAAAKALAAEGYAKINEAYEAVVVPPASSGARPEAERLFNVLQGTRQNLQHALTSLGALPPST